MLYIYTDCIYIYIYLYIHTHLSIQYLKILIQYIRYRDGFKPINFLGNEHP